MVGHNIAMLRKQQGLRQKELASLVGICEDYISMIETGRRIPSRKTLARIAHALGVNLEKLIN